MSEPREKAARPLAARAGETRSQPGDRLQQRPPALEVDAAEQAARASFDRFTLKAPPEPTLGEKLRRTWSRHPLVALIQHRKRVVFYQQFLSLVRSGAGIPVALAQLARWAPSSGFRSAIEGVAREVGRGANLGEALRQHASTFDDTNVELLVFAEQSGSLDKVLARIIDYMEGMQKLRWSVVMSLLYPGYLILAFTFAGPLLGLSLGIREGAGMNELPKLYVSGLATNLLVLGAGLAVFLGMPMLLAALGLDRGWDRLKLKLPLFGPAYRAIHGARFFTSLAMGLGAGVEVSRTVTLALRSTGSADLAASAAQILARIRRGASLAEALEPMPVLDPMSLGAIAIAERTGTLDETLERLADESAESAVRRCKALAVAGVVVLTAGALGVILKGLLAVILGPIADYFRQMSDI